MYTHRKSGFFSQKGHVFLQKVFSFSGQPRPIEQVTLKTDLIKTIGNISQVDQDWTARMMGVDPDFISDFVKPAVYFQLF